MIDPVMWTYWDQNAGVPKGTSKVHLMDREADKTLCGISLENKDSEYGHGFDDCKVCQRKAERIEEKS